LSFSVVFVFFSFHFWTPVVWDLLPSYHRLLYLLASLDKYFILISPAAAGPASSYTLRLFWSLAALSCTAVCCNCTATPLSDAATSTDFTRFSLDYHDCKAGPRSSFESPCSLLSNPLDREKQGAARSQSCRASNPSEEKAFTAFSTRFRHRGRVWCDTADCWSTLSPFHFD
jgi:hypothetical protein